MGATPADRLRQVRIARGYESASAAAEAHHWNINTYVSNENGNAPFSFKKATSYAEAFGVNARWLYEGLGPMRDDGRRTVPLVGYVGAGAEAHFYATGDEGLGEVDAPEGATLHTRAALVRGESLGPLFESWLIFYDDVRTPVTPDLHGKLCIVGLENDKVLVKKIKATGSPGIYHLLSNNEAPMFDQRVLWAALVKHMTPR